MRLAIVGSVSLWGNRKACDAICHYLDMLSPQTVVSGGALGVDTMAYYIAARVYRMNTHIYFPENERWAPTGYKERNLRIAQDCDQLLRVVAKDSKTYGSGWTRDQARKLGVQCFEVVI